MFGDQIREHSGGDIENPRFLNAACRKTLSLSGIYCSITNIPDSQATPRVEINPREDTGQQAVGLRRSSSCRPPPRRSVRTRSRTTVQDRFRACQAAWRTSSDSAGRPVFWCSDARRVREEPVEQQRAWTRPGSSPVGWCSLHRARVRSSRITYAHGVVGWSSLPGGPGGLPLESVFSSTAVMETFPENPWPMPLGPDFNRSRRQQRR